MSGLGLKQKLWLLVAVFTMGFAISSAFSLATINQIKVNGPIYQGIVQQKDLLADILPPPEYLLEAYLVSFQMAAWDKAELPALIEKSKALAKDFEVRREYWSKELPEGEIKTLIVVKAYKPGREFLDILQTQFIPALQKGSEDKAVVEIQARLTAKYNEHRTAIDELVKKTTDYASEEEKKSASLIQSKNTLAISIIIGFLALSLVISQWITRDVMRELGGEPAFAAKVARQIASGDLTQAIKTEPGDDASLVVAMKQMQEALREIISNIQRAATDVAHDAATMSQASRQVSVSSDQQSESASSMAAAVEQLTVSISHVASSADDALGMARESGSLSEEGNGIVRDAIVEIDKIANAFSETTQLIQTLGEQSNRISAIVNVIKEIADQTNLLALNAAIEAARAGEQGRGFAVVADEVRKLAERTTQSAQEIVTMIDAVQDGTQSAVRGMMQGSNQVADGVDMAGRAGNSMVNIEASSRKVISSVTDISSALREQSAASTQIAQNVERIATMAEENVAAVRDVAHAAEHLEGLAGKLSASVGRFRMS
jgi:methyl-accepting chemotaxis protein